MRKGRLFLLLLMCSMLVACKKDGPTGIDSTETELDGVQIVEMEPLYEYNYEEQSGGTLLFSIKGKWGENQSWVLETNGESVAKVKEVSQNSKSVKYKFSPKKNAGGYSDFVISLCDNKTKEATYFYVVSVMVSQDGKKLSVLNVYYNEPQKETKETEETEETEETISFQEVLSSEEQMELEIAEKKFDEIVGELSFPEEFTSISKEMRQMKFDGEERTVSAVSFVYKENLYNCIISPSIPLSTFQKEMGIDEEQCEKKMINEVEVSIYQEDNSRSIMWKNPDAHRYILFENGMTSDAVFEIVELLMK